VDDVYLTKHLIRFKTARRSVRYCSKSTWCFRTHVITSCLTKSGPLLFLSFSMTFFPKIALHQLIHDYWMSLPHVPHHRAAGAIQLYKFSSPQRFNIALQCNSSLLEAYACLPFLFLKGCKCLLGSTSACFLG